MKSKLILMLFALSMLAVVGCDDDDCIFNPVPAAPQGVFSITGDSEVYIYWYGPYEGDIVEYIIWRSDEPITGYREIGRRLAVSNPNLDLVIYKYIDENLQNGHTYYYAVSAVDDAGQVSDLSAEEVFDTPRPEGEVVLYDEAVHQELSGYHFASYSRINPSLADVYVDRVEEVFFLNVANDSTDIQDMGYSEIFNEIGYAPQDGWSDLGWVEIIVGHTYVIWTDDFRFAKMRVESIDHGDGIVLFRWAYQTAPNNPELVAPPEGLEKPVHGPGYLRKDNKPSSLK